MSMPPRLRKPLLIVHVFSSVGWAGAVVGFLALAVVGLASPDIALVRAVDLAAEAITRFAIVPLALASLLSGIVQSLGTPWGLLRHYWVLYRLALNIIAVVIVLLYSQTLDSFKALAAQPGASLAELRAPTFVLHATLALLVLLVATVLAVYKPRGMTRYGQRKQQEQRLQQREHRTALAR